MAGLGFDEATHRLFMLAGARRLEEALELAADVEANHPDHAARTAFWRACFLSLTGRGDEALAALENALERGAWWPASWLDGDPDLVSIRPDPRFGDVKRRSEAGVRLARERFADRPDVRLLLPPGDPKALLLVLHMLGRTIAQTEPIWSSGPALGVAIAFVESSQRSADDEPCWEFDDLVERDLSLALGDVAAAGLNPDTPLVLAGASQGGRRAVEHTIAPTFGAEGFLAVVPGPPEEARIAPHVHAAAERRVRGWVLVGEEDWDASAGERLARDLSTQGVEVRLESVPRLGHAYPEDFPARLPEAVDFVLDGRGD